MRKENKRLLCQIKKNYYMQNSLFKPLNEGTVSFLCAHERVKGNANKITSIQNSKGKLVDSSNAMGDLLNDYYF